MSKRNLIYLIIFAVFVAVIYIANQKEKASYDENIEAAKIKVFPDISVTSIKEISLKNEEKEKVTFKKSGNTWIVKEKNFPADSQALGKIINALPDLRQGDEIATYSDDLKKRYGFDKGLTLTIDDKTIVWGSSKAGKTFLKKDDKIYLSPFSQKHLFTKHDNEWREKKLFPGTTGESIQEIILAVNESKTTLTRDQNNEIKVTGLENSDPEKAATFFNTVANLSISSFIENNVEKVTEEAVTEGDEKEKRKVPSGSLTIKRKDGKTFNITLTGKKLKDKSEYIIQRNDHYFTLSQYYFSKLSPQSLLK